MKLKVFVLLGCLLATMTFISCSGEDGAVGPTGPAGPTGGTGAPGNNGDNGIDCWDLNADGVNDDAEDINGDDKFDSLDCQGQDGADGQNGNANVQKITIDVSQIAVDKRVVVLNVPEMTREVLQNHFPIFYLEAFDETAPSYLTIPGGFTLIDRSYDVFYFPENVQLRISNFDRTDTNGSGWTADWDFLHIVLIETSSLQGKSSKDLIKNLKAKGVNIEDYHEVMQYFGLE